jgi:histidinol-phosphate/aromatic aminotransferase/cobyric acid decarboxylase-like protein
MIRARQIQREKGLPSDVNVTGICEAAGISRKTGYEWAEKVVQGSALRQKELEEELSRLGAQHEKLKQNFADVNFENKGRKLAWEIHEVDKWLALKKSTLVRKGKKKR